MVPTFWKFFWRHASSETATTGMPSGIPGTRDRCRPGPQAAI